MELPSIVHPNRYEVKGILLEVVSYNPLPERQARAIALMFYRQHKFTRRDQGRLFRVVWTGNPEFAG